MLNVGFFAYGKAPEYSCAQPNSENMKNTNTMNAMIKVSNWLGSQITIGLKSTLLFLLVFSGTEVLAQDWDAEITVPRAGLDRFSVCDSSRRDTFFLTNTSITGASGNTLDNVTMNLALPTGLYYVPGSVTTLAGSPVSISETSPVVPSFSFSGPVPAGATVSFTLDIGADCGAIPLVTNDETVDFRMNLNYTGGNSSSFTALTPKFEVTKPLLNITSQVPYILDFTINKTDSIAVELVNGGQGPLDSFQYYVAPHPNLTLNYIRVGSKLIYPSGVVGGYYRFTFGYDEIMTARATVVNVPNELNYFQFNEEITVWESWTATSCNLSAPNFLRGYSYGCSGTVCEAINENSRVRFGNFLPNVYAYTDGSFEENHSVCRGDSAIAKFYLWNRGNAKASNIRFDIATLGSTTGISSNYLDTNNIQFEKRNAAGTVLESWAYIKPTVSYPYPTGHPSCAPSGSNVSRVDYWLNSTYDLEPGERIYIIVKYYQGCGCNEANCRIYQANAIRLGYNLSETDDPCAFPTKYDDFRVAHESLDVYASTIVEGPSEIDSAEVSCFSYDFTSYYNRYYYRRTYLTDDLARAKFQIVFSLPEGADFYNSGVESFKLTRGTASWTPTSIQYVDNNGGRDSVYINFTGIPPSSFVSSGSISAGIQMQICAIGDCHEVSGGPKIDTISQFARFAPDTACCGLECVQRAENQLVKVQDCPSLSGGGGTTGCRQGFVHTDFNIERINFGCGDDDNDGRFETGETLDLNTVRARRFIAGDTAAMTTKGVVLTSASYPSYSTGYVQTILPSGISSATILSGDIRIWDASASAVYTCNVLQQFQNGNDLLTNISIANMKTLGCTSLPAGFTAYENGDSICVNVEFKINDALSSGTEKTIIEDKTFLANSVWPVSTAEQDSGRCESGLSNILLVGMYKSFNHNSISTGGCFPAPFYHYDYRAYGSNDQTDYFPNEIRPETAYLKSVRMQLPPDLNELRYVRVRLRSRAAVSDYDFSINLFASSQFVTQYAADSILVDIAGLRDSLGVAVNDCHMDQGWLVETWIYVNASCETTTGYRTQYNRFFAEIITNPLVFGTSNANYTTSAKSHYFNNSAALAISNYPTDTIKTLTKSICFEVDLANTSSGTVNNVWFTFRSPQGNVIVKEVTETTAGGAVINPSGTGMYTLGTINSGGGTNRRLNICVEATDCDLSELVMYYGFDCSEVPNSLLEARCVQQQDFQFTGYPTELQQILIDPVTPSTIQLCDTSSFTILISSGRLGHLYDVTQLFRLPFGLDYIPGSFEYAWPLQMNGTTVVPTPWTPSLVEPVNVFGNMWRINVSEQDLELDQGDGLPGVLRLDSNYLLIRFKVTPQCGFRSGSRAKFLSWAFNACGEFANSAASPSENIRLQGVSATFLSNLRVSVDSINACESDVTPVRVAFRLKKASLPTQPGDSVSVTLPQGVYYSPNSYNPISNAINAEPELDTLLGMQVLTWTMKTGVPGGSRVKFSFDLQASDVGQDCGEHDLVVQTFSTVSDTCRDANGNTLQICDVQNVSDQEIAVIKIVKPDLQISAFSALGTALPPDSVRLEACVTVNNAGEAVSAGSNVTIDIYNDVNNNGKWDDGIDVLLGAIDTVLTNDIPRLGTFTYCGTLNVLATTVCNLIAVVDPDNNCNCGESESKVISTPIEMDYDAEEETCSDVPIQIGTTPVTGWEYDWIPVGGASAIAINPSDQAITTFNAGNSTQSDIVWQYVLRTTKGSCIELDTVQITIFPSRNDSIFTSQCDFDTFRLVGPLGGTNYLWEPTIRLEDPTDPRTRVFEAPTAITYRLSYIDSNGCPGVFVQRINPIPCSERTSLGDTVWCDLDANGVQDPGEPGIAGVTATLYACSDLSTPLKVVTTDANGRYLFSPLGAGSYVVKFDRPTDKVASPINQTTDDRDNDVSDATLTSHCVTLANGDSVTTVDAGFYKGVAIGDTVWHDRNLNNQQDPGEEGIAGVRVNLFNANTNTQIGTMLTDANGRYYFSGLPLGSYYVVFDHSSVPTGFAPVSPNIGPDATDSDADSTSGRTHTVTFTVPDTKDTTVDAGYYLKASLGNYVWEDLNGDGQQQFIEPGVADVVVHLLDASGNIVAKDTTDQFGLYNFDCLKPTDYSVQFFKPTGYNFTVANMGDDTYDSDPDSTSGITTTYNLSPGENDTTVDAGLWRPAALGNRVWLDNNENATQDLGEPSYTATPVEVVLLDAAGTPLETTFTDANGYYLFDGLRPGDYRVQFEIPFGYEVTDANFGTSGDTFDSDADPITGITHLISLSSNELDTTIDMGIYLSAIAVLGDTVWCDINGDGIQDLNEPGISDVRVYLYDCLANELIDSVLTNANGFYEFDSLRRGTYRVQFIAPSGKTYTDRYAGTDTTQDSNADANGFSDCVSISGTDTISELDAGFYAPAGLGDTVWVDYNANGVQDPTEPGIGNVVVELLDVAGNVLETTMTNSSGYYDFTDLQPGDYKVRIALPTGYIATGKDQGGDDLNDSDIDPTTLTTISINLISEEFDPTWDAGIFRYSSIGDTLWCDTDGDGIQDPNEPGIGGTKVYLYACNGTTPIDSTITAPDGSYIFDSLLIGNYQVRFDDVDGKYFTTQTAGSNINIDSDADDNGLTACIPITDGDTIKHIDAGVYPSVSLGDTVWYDQNGNGTQDPTEIGIVGVKVTLFTGAGVELSTTETDANGYYTFDDLERGSYYVVFDHSTAPTGYLPTDHNAGGDDTIDSDADINTGQTQTVNLIVPGTRDSTLDAGYYSPASLGDYVWIDVDGNGQQGIAEPVVSNVKVTLYDNGGNVLETTLTDANGKYLFDELDPGDYKVGFELPSGFEFTSMDNGPDATDSDPDRMSGITNTITLVPGQVDTSWDAGIYAPASLGDTVWVDYNADGLQSPTEPGIANVVVELLDVAGNVVETTMTNGSGFYNFTGLQPGDYSVRIQLPTGYIATQKDAAGSDADDSDIDPTTLRTDNINLITGEHDPTWDAGVFRYSSIGDTLWCDTDGDGIQDPNEPGIGGTKVYLYACNGTTPIDSTITAPDGSYIFDSLLIGNYQVRFDDVDSKYFTTQTAGSNINIDSDADDNGWTACIPITDGDTIKHIDAGVYPSVSLGDTVWYDYDGDGTQDPTETGIAGVKVTLFTGAGVELSTTETDANGYYTFDDLERGSYYVVFDHSTAPTGYLPTDHNAGGDDTIDSDADVNTGQTQTVNLIVPGTRDSTLDAGYYWPASIGDYVWEDVNGDGQQGTAEPVISAVKVTLYDASGNAIETTLTDANGKYLFDELDTGNYKVGFDLPTGFRFTGMDLGSDLSDSDPDTISGMTIYTNLIPGENDTTWDAGMYVPASLGDYVWRDDNADGIQDNNEIGIEGVTVYLLDAVGNRIKTTSTDGTGFYEFTGLYPANYSVEFTNVPGYRITDRNQEPTDSLDSDADINTLISQVEFLESREHDPTIDAGFVPFGYIGDYVWCDDNADGIQDQNEAGIPNINVYLYDASNTTLPLQVTQTDINGIYFFDSLEQGNYIVGFDLPTNKVTTLQMEGLDPTVDSDVDTVTRLSLPVTILPGDTNITIDAGFYPGVSLGDTVWNDLDGDGIQEAGEPGIGGVVVRVYEAITNNFVTSRTTDLNGRYIVEGLPMGSYYVVFDHSTTPPGYIPTLQNVGSDNDDSDADVLTGRTHTTNLLTPGARDTTLDAGYFVISGLGDYVWEDLNANGIQDAGEPGIQGVIVTLYNLTQGSIVGTTATDGNGYYFFGNLPAGSYEVEFTKPGGYIFSPQGVGVDRKDSDADETTGRTGIINLGANQVDTTWDAGLYRLAAIGDYVWQDLNADGRQDVIEPVIPGVLVELLDAAGNVLQTTLTDAQGHYLFDNLLPGNYKVRFGQPTGLVATITNQGGDDMLDSDAIQTSLTTTLTELVSGERDTTWDAGFFRYMSIGDTVWCDLDGDGIQDPQEPGVSGVKVYLYECNNPLPIDSTITDANGRYILDSLLAGNYQVRFEDVPGKLFTQQGAGTNTDLDSDADPSTGFTSCITVTDGDTITDIDAGVYESVRLGDFVWNDLDADGQQDNNEPGISGVTVTLFNATTGAMLETTATDVNGWYNFADLPLGSYYVVFDHTTVPTGFSPTLHNVGNDAKDSDADPTTGISQTVNLLTPGAVDTTIDAGYLVPAALGNRVWNDLDADGSQDAGEAGVPNVLVELLDPSGNVLQTTLTDANGLYLFAVAPGDYRVRFNEPFSYALSPTNTVNDTIDSDANVFTGETALITIGAGMIDTTWDAGIYRVAALGDTVWHDLNANGVQDAGEPGIGGVQIRLQELISGIWTSTLSTTTNPNGYYAFNNLAPGTYRVMFSYPSGGPTVWNLTAHNQGGDDAKDSDANPTTLISHAVTLAAGQQDPTIDAGFYQYARLGDYVWEDLNGDGIQDANEPPVRGVVVELLDVSGNVLETTATDANGEYWFTDLDPGNYVVRVIVPSTYKVTDQNQGTNDAVDSDIDPVTMLTGIRTLVSMQTDSTNDAGIYRPAALGDYVWEDLNGDGIQDPNEPGIGGVLVELLDASGNVLATTTTNPAGAYNFTDLDPGDYLVRFNPPTGYIVTDQNAGTDDSVDSDIDDTTFTSHLVNLESGETDNTIDAGLLRPASLGDFVWVDKDGDGIQDGGEPGISGVLVELIEPTSGAVLETTLTNGTGFYGFNNLDPGSYQVRFNKPGGYEYTKQNVSLDDTKDSDPNTTTGLSHVVSLIAGQHDPTIDAGVYLPAALGDTVWNDLNGDGIQDPNEPGVGGVVVELIDPATGNVLATTTTDPNGKYGFDNLAPGEYQVRFNPPTGYVVTDQNQGTDDALDSDIDNITFTTGTVTLESGETDNTIDAGLLQRAALGDYVWEDLNRDGIQDSNEPAIQGVTVELLDLTGNVLETTTTDASGRYWFSNLDPGDYRVRVTPPANYFVTDANQGTDDALDSDIDVSTFTTGPINLIAGEMDSTNDAGLYRLAALGDYVWEDLNGDGIQDGVEPGVGGVVVELLDANTGAVLQTTTTNPSGYYNFTGLVPGDYQVRFTPPPGYSVTDQNQGTNDGLDSDIDKLTGTSHVVNLESGETDNTIDAGLNRKSALGNYVWFDANKNGLQDPNEMGIARVKVTLLDAATGNALATTQTDANGFYLFTGLDVGIYQLCFDSTSFPFGVDGITRLSPTVFNAGANDTIDSDVIPMGPNRGYTTFIPLGSGVIDTTWDLGLVDFGPTPVELLYFTAKAREGKVFTEWVTVAEINNERFEVERTVDPASGEVEHVGTIAGNGTTSQTIQYNLTDHDPHVGRSYYRLVQYDFDGTKTTLDWVEVYIGLPQGSFEVTAFPIPAVNELNLVIDGVVDEALVRIYDMNGKLVQHKAMQGNGQMIERFDISQLAAGVYNLEVRSAAEVKVMRVIKQ